MPIGGWKGTRRDRRVAAELRAWDAPDYVPSIECLVIVGRVENLIRSGEWDYVRRPRFPVVGKMTARLAAANAGDGP